MESLTTILVAAISSIIGSGTITGIVVAIIYRKQNKTIKDEEAKSSQLDNEIKKVDMEAKKLDNDQKQIDLGDMYLKKVQEIADMLIHSDRGMEEFENKWTKKMDDLTKKINYCCTEIGSMSDYLNGGYHDHKVKLGLIKELEAVANETEVAAIRKVARTENAKIKKAEVKSAVKSVVKPIKAKVVSVANKSKSNKSIKK